MQYDTGEYYLGSLGCRGHMFESYSRHGCLCVCVRLFHVYVVLCRYRSCDELITRPRSPTECPRLRNWSETESFMDAPCSSGREKGNEKITIRNFYKWLLKFYFGHPNPYLPQIFYFVTDFTILFPPIRVYRIFVSSFMLQVKSPVS
jgi:hypothetical protein